MARLAHDAAQFFLVIIQFLQVGHLYPDREVWIAPVTDHELLHRYEDFIVEAFKAEKAALLFEHADDLQLSLADADEFAKRRFKAKRLVETSSPMTQTGRPPWESAGVMKCPSPSVKLLVMRN